MEYALYAGSVPQHLSHMISILGHLHDLCLIENALSHHPISDIAPRHPIAILLCILLAYLSTLYDPLAETPADRK
jgi:hypothetical protein